MMQKPKRLLAVAGICAVAFFLLGAPEITDSAGAVQQVGIWLQFGAGFAGLATLALGLRGLFVRRSSEK